VLYELGRDATEKETSERAQTLGTADDEIALVVLGGFKDLIARIAELRQLADPVPRSTEAFNVAGQYGLAQLTQLWTPTGITGRAASRFHLGLRA
jgi:hypothetical protein